MKVRCIVLERVDLPPHHLGIVGRLQGSVQTIDVLISASRACHLGRELSCALEGAEVEVVAFQHTVIAPSAWMPIIAWLLEPTSVRIVAQNFTWDRTDSAAPIASGRKV